MALEQYLTLTNTEDENRLINASYKDCVFVMTGKAIIADIADQVFDFKYHLEILIDDVVRAKLQSPTGVFRIEQILQDHTRTDNSGYGETIGGTDFPQSTRQYLGMRQKRHAIHFIDNFARNSNNMIKVSFRVGASFFIENGTFYGEVMSNPTPSKNGCLVNCYYYFNATEQHQGLDTFNITPFLLENNARKFLTFTQPSYNRKVRLSDYHTLAFINGTFCKSGKGGQDLPMEHAHDDTFIPNQLAQEPCERSCAYYIYADALSDNGSVIWQARVRNFDDNGGSYCPDLSDCAINPYDLRKEDKSILYVGVGPQNMINSTVNANLGWRQTNGNPVSTSQWGDVATYRVYATNAGATRISAYYNFEIDKNDCKGFETIRLAYLNRMGAWDYYNFTKKSQKSTNITRSNFKQFYGSKNIRTFKDNPCNLWDYGAYEGGTKTYNVNAINVFEANSDFITEDDAIHMEELFTSPDVYMYQPRYTAQGQNAARWIPVVVTEKDYIKQTKANDKLIQYVVQIQQGHETRIQRL